MNKEQVQRAIADECDFLKALLIAKNEAYGNSALDPVRMFSKASAEEQLLVRIDDKLSRLVRGDDAGEDVVQDLLGYLVLLRVCRKLSSAFHGSDVAQERDAEDLRREYVASMQASECGSLEGDVFADVNPGSGGWGEYFIGQSEESEDEAELHANNVAALAAAGLLPFMRST